MTAQTSSSRYPDLPGFAKENRELVYAMTEAGWRGRMTSKGHYLAKAPDGKQQITVPAKNGNNRGLKNSHAAFLRWVKANMPAAEIELWDIAKKETDPLLQDVMAEGLVRKQATRTMQEQAQREYDEIIETFEEIMRDPRATVEPLIRPWLAKKSPSPNGGKRYESQAVLERVWPNGLTDYACAFAGCDYGASSPQSVARHFAGHTRRGDSPPAEIGPIHPDPTYTEPESHRDYRPTQRLVRALLDVLYPMLDKGVSGEEMATTILTWMNDRPDIDHEERPLIPLTDRQILDKVRMLVGQPDQSMEIDALRTDIAILESEVHRLREERTALRELLS